MAVEFPRLYSDMMALSAKEGLLRPCESWTVNVKGSLKVVRSTAQWLRALLSAKVRWTWPVVKGYPCVQNV